MVDDLHSHTLPIELGYKILEEACLQSLPRDSWSPVPPRRTRRLPRLLPRISSRSCNPRLMTTTTIVAYSVPCTCNSITFHIYDPSPLSSSSGVFHLYGSSNPTTRAMETILRAINANRDPLAPALHRVALHYTGWSFTRELEHARLVNLPSRVQYLELCFSTPSLFTQHLRQSYLRRCALPMPGVRTLGIYGACPAFVVDVARACPALQRLETDDVRGVLVLQPSLRPFMLLTADDEHLGRKSAPDEQASVVDAFARVPEDMRRKPGLPYGFLLKRKPARI
ncbi:hypothetical protein EDB92DRAFT_2111085 [Lactarius akahatsu]|uniref:Uncharacterized protein n=1 Tax=Lactarius akahatsu TaxID=416441 RepID=A0AAD4QCS2_9AGAM|nr:hypothetical protein EDB92DRAFT_2111085 [Lactarius akahatsu]